MKLLSLVVAVGLSANAFGFHQNLLGHYVGGGTWQMPTGERGRWQAHLVIGRDKSGFVMREALTIINPDGTSQKEASELNLLPEKNGFFKVADKGKALGMGYCVRNQCHLETLKGEEKSEETLTFARRRIHRMGSHSGKDFTVIWNGTMRRQ